MLQRERMPVNSTHPNYDDHLPVWLRIRDVLAGDDAIKRGGAKYVPRLQDHTDAQFNEYLQRGFFYNATARTVGGYVGLIFRRAPLFFGDERGAGKRSQEIEVRSEETKSGTAPGVMGQVLSRFVNDVDLRGTTLDAYARHVVGEVISLGRSGTLIDWQEDESRAFVSHYPAESILNWRECRINGSLKLTLVVLAETVTADNEADPYANEEVEQIRVLRLARDNAERGVRNAESKTRPLTPALSPDGGEGVHSKSSDANLTVSMEPKDPLHTFTVEIWQRRTRAGGRGRDWVLVRSVTPTRRGRPLQSIPFVFHGPTHSRADVEKPPIADLVAANLDHYRLNTDYKHGMHFTALPTAFVSGFDRSAELKIGATTAWVTETIGATAGFLEFKGQGLGTFEKALDRTERLMTVLGSRLLETQKRVSESAEALAIRQAGESSIIGSLAVAVTASLNDVLRWVYWWHSIDEEAMGGRHQGPEL